MGTIPAPDIFNAANEIASTPQNTLADLARTQAIRQQTALGQQQTQGVQLDNQQRQRAFNDQQAMTTAMQQWDGKNVDDLPSLVLKNKGSANAVFGLQQQIMKRKQDMAALDKDQLANIGAHHDAALGVINAHENVPDEELGSSMANAVNGLVQQGHLRPDEAQAVMSHAQSMPGAQFRPWLDIYKKGLLGEKEQVAQEQKNRQISAEETTAQAKAQGAQTSAQRLQAEMPGGPLSTPAGEKEFQSYYRAYLGAKGQQPSAANEYAARQQYFKDKQPYGAQRLEIMRDSADRADRNADRKDTDFIDKNYVKPANDAEKSYQMFMEAYNNRNNAKTGAESMLALSTHLATTFGNVKGARVTKDMIQEHLGARGVGDKALVAVQKLTNGDVLSPDQWDAFKGLISNSRNLTWQTAKKEADRRGVDISDSMPGDLKAPKANPVSGGAFSWDAMPEHR